MKVRTEHELRAKLDKLCGLPHETEWVEFKHNNARPDDIGEYISALANSAALAGTPEAWLIWGVANDSHDVVGTSFNPYSARVGNEELENWLVRLLAPRVDLRFHVVVVQNLNVVMLEIGASVTEPIAFKKVKYIRVGSYKKRLDEHPEKEKALWTMSKSVSFERDVAAECLSGVTVLSQLDHRTYFEMLSLPQPASAESVLKALESDGMIIPTDHNQWHITNLGAILFANRLDNFPSLARKSIRVVQYHGETRVRTIIEQQGNRGYAIAFRNLMKVLIKLHPSNEVIKHAIRRSVPMFPELAVRELVANALIHQDFSLHGTGPMIEVFATRMEITNPGLPLVKTDRFLDSPPLSRNESMAKFMCRIGICEERGSGIDKVVFETELYQLPAPLFETTANHTRVVLFAHRELKRMDKADRIRACYLHACLRYVQRDNMSNTTLRQRFGINEKNSAVASRLIREALQAGLIVAVDPDAGRKYMKYVPWWAV